MKTGRSILVVDDESTVLKVICRLLQRLGDQVVSASSGDEALDKIQENVRMLDLMLVDHSMPDMTGAECIAEIRKLYPSVPAILMSGGKVLCELPENSSFLAKPFSAEDLLNAVNTVARV